MMNRGDRVDGLLCKVYNYVGGQTTKSDIVRLRNRMKWNSDGPEASPLNSQLSDCFFVHHSLYTDVNYHRTHYCLQNWK